MTRVESEATFDTDDVVDGPDVHEALAGTDDLAAQTVRGVGWTAASQVGRQLAQTVFSIVVARLLLPEHFGQVSQVLVLSGLANIFADFGFGSALVQRKEIEERHTSSVFWVQLALGGAVAIVVAASSPLIASFYGDPGLVGITLALCPYFLLSAACTVQRGLLLRRMQFRTNAKIEVSAVLASGVACVTAAALGAKAYSIVVQQLTFAVVTVVLLWSVAHWRPRRMFDRTAIRELLPFSGNLLGFTLINYTIRNGDNLLVGRLMGATALGLYTRGYSILLLPTRQITSMIGKVMFASLSRVNDDEERLRRGYLRAVSVIALITFPLMTGIALVADDFVPVLLGHKWDAAIPIIRIFALLGITESIATSVGWIYTSTGRTDVLLKWALWSGGVPLAGIAIGSRFGSVDSVTIGYAVSTTLLVYPCFRVAGGLINMRVREVVRAVVSTALCTAVMAAVVLAVNAVLPHDLAHATALVPQVGAGVLTYALLVHFTKVDAYRDLRARLLDLRTSKSRAHASSQLQSS